MRNLKLYSFDLFPKYDKRFEDNARHKTLAGGIFSLATIGIILFLVFSEVRYFFSVVQHHKMEVDNTIEGSMELSIDLTIYHIPCDVLAVINGDVFGHLSPIPATALKKKRLNHTINPSSTPSTTTNGSKNPPCHSCFLTQKEKKCCQTCDDLREAYESSGLHFDVFNPAFTQCTEEAKKLQSTAGLDEGCRIYGSLSVPRVSGVLHILPARIMNIMGLQRYQPVYTCNSQLNYSHTISQLTFGEYFPGQLNPLVGAAQIRGERVDGTKKQANGRFSYFLQVIPTVFKSQSLLLGTTEVVESHQYSATFHYIPCAPEGESPTENQKGDSIQPGVFISYDLSPIKVSIRQEHPYSSVGHLILQLCAVCGGILTVAGLIDSLCFRGIQKIDRLRKRI